jgi:hypothetical protein
MAENGSAEDRGSADKYYGRPPDPHVYDLGTYKSPRRTELTYEEVEAYYRGYNNQMEEKDWGRDPCEFIDREEESMYDY